MKYKRGHANHLLTHNNLYELYCVQKLKFKEICKTLHIGTKTLYNALVSNKIPISRIEDN